MQLAPITFEAVQAMSPAERAKAFPTQQIQVSKDAMAFLSGLAEDVKAGRMTSAVAAVARRHAIYTDAKGRLQLRDHDTAVSAIKAELGSKTPARAPAASEDFAIAHNARESGLSDVELRVCAKHGMDPVVYAQKFKRGAFAAKPASTTQPETRYVPAPTTRAPSHADGFPGLTSAELASCRRLNLDPAKAAASLARQRGQHAPVEGLTAAQVAACARMGLDPEATAKALAEQRERHTKMMGNHVYGTPKKRGN